MIRMKLGVSDMKREINMKTNYNVGIRSVVRLKWRNKPVIWW